MFDFTLFQMLLIRQYRAIRVQLPRLLFNYWILWPLTFGLGRCYIASIGFFGPGHAGKGTMLFMGNILFMMVIASLGQSFEFLRERASNGGVACYHLSIGSTLTVLSARLFASFLFVLTIVSPVLFFTKLLLGEYCVLTHLNLGWFFTILILSAALTVTYGYCAGSIITGPQQSRLVWIRLNEPMLWLGGFWNPLTVMVALWAPFAFLSRLSPFIYVTEGLRRSVTGSSLFLPYAQVLPGLLIFTGLFFGATLWLVKRRLHTVA